MEKIKVQGGVINMLAAGAQAMCERPASIESITRQFAAIPGCIEYASLLDSFVETGDYIDQGGNTPLCKVAGPPMEDYYNFKGKECIKDRSSPKPNLCQNIGSEWSVLFRRTRCRSREYMLTRIAPVGQRERRGRRKQRA